MGYEENDWWCIKELPDRKLFSIKIQAINLLINEVDWLDDRG